MAKAINWNNFNQQFGESFIRTLDRERTLRQQQEEFNRKMQFENRQLDFSIKRNEEYQNYLNSTNQRQGYESFLQNFAPESTLGTGRENPRTGNFDYGENGMLSTPVFKEKDIEKGYGGLDVPEGNYIRPSLLPQTPKQEGIERTITDYTDPNKPVIFGITDSGKKIELGTGAPKTSKGGKNQGDKTPYYDLTKSGELFNKYQDINRAERDNLTGSYQYMTKEGTGVILSPTQKAELKTRTISDLEEATNNEARKINSKVPGFYSTYQALLNMIEKPEEIDTKVNEYLKDASSETRDAIKTLLKRRIFK